jgi:hypothetical protein
MTIVPKSRAHTGKKQLGASGAAAVIAGALCARGPLGDWVMLDRREPTRAREEETLGTSRVPATAGRA